MTMRRVLLAIALVLAPFGQAWAGSGTIITKDASGVNRTFSIITEGGGNFVSRTGICDSSAAANCLTVNSSGAAIVSGSAAQSGTWTVQPGNTPNSTPWLSTINQGGNSATVTAAGALVVSPTGAQPVSQSGAFTVDPTTISTWGLAGIGVGSAPAHSLIAGAIYNSTEISPVSAQTFALQADSKGRLRNVIMDAAGNTRGANVNASNQLSVSVDNASAVTVSGSVREINSDAVLAAINTVNSSVNSPIPAGNLAIGTVGISAVSSGGWSPFAMLVGPQGFGVIKGAAGILHAVQTSTISSSPAWLKFYDLNRNPNCGVDPVKKQIIIPVASTAANGAGNNATVLDAQFSSGIAWCLTVNIISSDIQSASANNFIINADYK